MSRLVNYGTGDVLDRLTILALKVLHYGAAGKDTQHLLDERNALLPKVMTVNLTKAALEALLELGAVNGALWGATDKLRELAPYHPETPSVERELAALGVQILRLNDRRAHLVDTINRETGEFRGAEKG